MMAKFKKPSKEEKLADLIEDAGEDFSHVTQQEFQDLLGNNKGCNKILSETMCVGSRDGRHQKTFHFSNATGNHKIRYDVSPCQWCCGHDCTPGGTKCEAREWLQTAGKSQYDGYGKNGMGFDNCAEKHEKVAKQQWFEAQAKMHQQRENERIFKEDLERRQRGQASLLQKVEAPEITCQEKTSQPERAGEGEAKKVKEVKDGDRSRRLTPWTAGSRARRRRGIRRRTRRANIA